MSNRLALLLGVHAHQPVGNFATVVDDAHLRCYRPFLHTLHRYPDFKFAAHFSGWLLAELAHRFPADLELLHAMVARGQVEMFGGGDCEPVLAAIPARDRGGQLLALSDRLARTFGQRPRGAWLTERVWEATVVPALRDTGHRYVTVDDYHFLCTGLAAADLDGYSTTEEDGGTLDLFPISEELRYRLPFSPAPEAVAYLEAQAAAGRQSAVYFDDIEKFGIWPETYAWVYEQRWLERFIEGVLASPVLAPMTYAEFHARHRSRGIVYLPTTSYSEMNEWTLPPAAAGRYAGLLARVKAGQHWEQERPFVRGGIWRNFFSRYPESNWMHKRMLGLSTRLAATGLPAAEATRFHDYLYQAQANDAYWHGLFGGLYLPHLRRAVWRNLIALEAGLDAHAARPHAEALDLDCDGVVEHVLFHGAVQIVLRDDGGGAAHELLSYPLGHNFGDTLRRHAEHYHQVAAQRTPHSADPTAGIASAHDRVAFKTEVCAADLVPDAAASLLFSDSLIAANGERMSLGDWRIQAADGREVRMTHELAGGAALAKHWQLNDAGLSVSYSGGLPDGVTLETEINLALPSADGFGGRYVLPDGSFPGGFGAMLEYADLKHLALEDAELRGRLALSCVAPTTAVLAPHYTVSQSEAGFEKIMQGVRIRLRWHTARQRVEIALSSCASWL